MITRILSERGEFLEAAALSAERHLALRAALPFLPPREAGDFLQRIEWIRDHGAVMGLFDGKTLAGFLGGFPIDDFRNAGKGAYCPDWCHGVLPGAEKPRAYRALYRAIAPVWIDMGARLHSVSLYATDGEALDAFGLTGFGRIVMDAAAPTVGVRSALAGRKPMPSGVAIRRAGSEDADSLAAMNAILAEHIASPPVLMPRARGEDAAEWRAWFPGDDAVAFIALDGAGTPIGYIRAEKPQFDVSYAVEDPSCLAINGMYVSMAARGAGVGRGLLAALADHAASSGKTMMSVDCETTNPEAFGFWTRWFSPLGWSLERRA